MLDVSDGLSTGNINCRVHPAELLGISTQVGPLINQQLGVSAA